MKKTKLKLNRVTLQALTKERLGDAVGGVGPRNTGLSCNWNDCSASCFDSCMTRCFACEV
jgi:hypothetical protein